VLDGWQNRDIQSCHSLDEDTELLRITLVTKHPVVGVYDTVLYILMS